MAGRMRAAVVVAAIVFLAALAAIGAETLDARFAARRFEPSSPWPQCPIAVWRGQAEPMCSARPGW